jgi:hypothetical protein
MCSKQNFIIIFLALLLLSSCAPVYVPTKNNVPLLSEKGEFQAFAGIGLGVNTQAAYALTDNIGISTSYLYANNSEDNGTVVREHQAGEIAIGYYKNLNSNLCFEVYGGYGGGKGQAIDTSNFLFANNLYAKGSYQKFFVQPAIGSNKNRFNWNVSIKCSLVDFTSIKVKEGNEILLSEISPKIFLTPSFSCSLILWKTNLSASFQTGINAHVGSRTIYDYEFLMLSVGLAYAVKPKNKTP